MPATKIVLDCHKLQAVTWGFFPPLVPLGGPSASQQEYQINEH